MPFGKSPGPSIKNPAQYEALKRKGMSKMQAAMISNASVKRKLAKMHAKSNPGPAKHHSSAHPGFQNVQSKIAKQQGISQERAGAILAASTRRASRAAKKANPRLKRVM